MSQEIDQRVVEMRFDNAQFEEKSRKTMRTLDKLREKLRFDGAEKGIEKVQQAADDVDFSGMETGLDRVQEKFSALDVIAFTTLQNITNCVISTGEQMVKSLSLDQVTSGWDKYVEKTGNVQTIMNATGKSIDQVNGYLNKLMWYSDETSYSFDEMTSALSQMTASGGNIEKMIPMIMGIANATADAGKTGFAFQSTIRNLTQSYSAGHLQLQDWKSLNLMGTATKALKQELISTAEELGVIKKGSVTIASFESSLSKKWANTTVMEKTFEKYASMMEAAYDLIQKEKANGNEITSSEALDRLKGQYGELAERAALAAQQATSFSQAIDSTKDAVSSKWMSVFETIFGNKEEATKTWTELANRLYDVFVPGVEAMNDRLREGLDTGWEQLRRRFGDQADLYATALEKVALSSGAVSEQAIEEAGSFAEALKQGKVDASLLGTSLEETIASYERMLATVSEDDPRYSHIQKDYEAFLQLNEAVEDGSLDLEHYADKITEVSGREHLMQSLWNIWDAIAKVMGTVHEAFAEIFPPTSGEQIHSIAEGLDVMTGKLILSDEAAEKVKSIATGVFSVLKVGKDILSDIASVIGNVLTAATPLATVLVNIALDVGSCVTEVTSDLHPLKELGAWVTNFVSSIAPALYSFGSSANKTFSDFANGAKDAFNGLDTDKVNDFISGGLGIGVLTSLKKYLDSAKPIGASVKDIIGGVKDCIDSLGEAITTWKQAKKAETLLTIAKSVAIIAGSFTVLSMVQPERLNASLETMTVAFAELLGVMTAMTAMSKNVKSLKLSALAVGMVAVSGAVLILAGALKVISTIEQDSLLSSVAALGGVMTEMTVVALILSKFAGRFMKGATGVIAFAAGIRILVSSMQVLGAMSWTEIGHGLAGIGGLCAELGIFAAALSKVKFGVLKGAGFVLLATSVNLLVGAFSNFASMEWDAIGRGLAAIGGALLEFVIALNLARGTLGSAAGITLMVGAINLLVPAFRGLSELSLPEIGTALLAIAGAFTVLGVAAFFLGPVTPIVVALSLSLSALALSIGALLALSSASAFIGNLAASLSLLRSLDFQVFLNSIKAAAWMLVEFVAGVIKGIGEIAGTLVTSVAKIIKAVCDAIVLAAPSIAEALYVVGTVAIDTLIRLIAYLWEKCEPALDDLWSKFTTWLSATTKDFNILDFLQFKWENPFAPLLDELKNGDSFAAGIYQMFAGIGNNAAGGAGRGVRESSDDAVSAVTEMTDEMVQEGKDNLDIASPSKVFEQIGKYVTEGLAIGILDEGALSNARTAMQTVAESIRKIFTGYWKIHSPSQLAENDGLNIAEGLALGMKDQTKAQEIRNVSYAMADNVRLGAEQALNAAQLAIAEKMKGVWNLLKGESLAPEAKIGGGAGRLPREESEAEWLTELAEKVISKDITREEAQKQVPSNMQDWFNHQLVSLAEDTAPEAMSPEELYAELLAQYDDLITNGTNPTGTGTGKTKSSGKQKTLAETIAEKYTKELKANKYLQDAASKEYTLWENTEGDTASIEALIEKKGETLAASIELQTARVDIAQRQYDELLSRVGADDDKTKDARATLLDEKNTLAELRKQRYETLYKTAIERYESEDDVAQSEYQLWADTYEKTASVTEKNNKEIEQINKRLATQSAKTALAEKAWADTCDALGEASVEAQARYLELLKQRQAEQELKNELADAQLDLYDKLDAEIQNKMSAAKKRQSLLDKLYNDGDLASRESAYESAVEQYGADSLEARRAATQGTMSALMGVASAMNNLQFQMKTLTNAQNKYDAVLKEVGNDRNNEKALEAYGEVMDARNNFADYMENLADAFDVSDGTKRAMMQVGDALAKNWKKIQNGMDKVLAKVNPQVADSLKNVVGLYMREGASETMSATANAIVAAMSGDWAQAVASGLAAVLNVVGTDFGRTLTEAIGNALKLAFNGNGLFMQLLMKFFGGGADLGGSSGSGGFLSKVWNWVKNLFGGKSGSASGTGNALESISNSLNNLSGGGGSSGGLFSKVLDWGKSLLGLGKAAKTTSKIIPVISTATAETGTAAVATTEAVAGAGGLTAALGKVGTMIASVASKLGPKGLLVGAVIAGGTLLISNWDKVREAIGSAWGWVKEKVSGLWEGVKNVAGGLWNGLTTVVGGAVNVGKNIVGGLWNGIKTVAGGLWNGVKSVCGGILDGVKSFFGIASPSKVMAGIGVYIGEGLTNGIIATAGEAEKGMDEVGNAVLKSAHTVGEHIADFMASDDSAQPTIRPVVDLSEASRSSAWLNSAFADRKGTISMAATVTGQMARQMGTATKVQNGTERQTVKPQSNRDVVEAVAALGDRIDGIAKAVSNMQVVLNGKKLVGGIKSDMNAALGSMVR